MKILFGIIFIVFFSIGCNKLVSVENPPTGVDAKTVYTEDGDAIAVLNGLYQTLITAGDFTTGINSLSCIGGLSADELTGYPANGDELYAAYQNALNSNPTTYVVPFWGTLYSEIYVTNTAIAGLQASTSLTPAVKQELLGEAQFMRAFFYFYLINLWGDVPLVLTTDYKTNGVMSRTPQSLVWAQIISDLKSAESLLNQNFIGNDALSSSTERTRPNKWAAAALLARVYLYQKDYSDAIAQSTMVINNNSLFRLVGLDTVFLKNNNEAIWQLEPITPSYNTLDAVAFILETAPNPAQPVSLSPHILSSFESGDQRFVHWVDSINADGIVYYYPYKYKVNSVGADLTEYLDVLRLGEQYLVRAEASANLGNLNSAGGAIADLDTIRYRASLPDYTGSADQASVLAAIAHERQVEFFTEWGHRWLDLKRTNKMDSVMIIVAPSKQTTWNPDRALYPIPYSDIQFDHNLVQNPGYN